MNKRVALIGRGIDFWLLGGASVVLWLVLKLSESNRGDNGLAARHFGNLAFTFSSLSIFCNYPHFISSYKFGYTRGALFVRQYAIQLIVVPLLLLAVLFSGYSFSSVNPQSLAWVVRLNRFMEFLGTSFRFGTLPNLGFEVANWLNWCMFMTVGWHYSKQVFGCVLVYAHYDGFRFSKGQRFMLKVQLFSIAFASFFSSAMFSGESLDRFGVKMVSLPIPHSLAFLSEILSFILTLSVVLVLILHGKKNQQWPSPNMMVSWIAFVIWWHPWFRQYDFYVYAVPFFHSLQYLPFAFLLEKGEALRAKNVDWAMSVRVLIIVAVGFFVFEGFPVLMDRYTESPQKLGLWYFTTGIVVLLNIQHYFVDSVIWKFSQLEMRNRILE